MNYPSFGGEKESEHSTGYWMLFMCSGCVTPFVREVSKNVHNSSDDHTCKLLNCEVMMMPPEFRGEISWMTCRWSRSRRLSCNRNIVSSVRTVFQAV